MEIEPNHNHLSQVSRNHPKRSGLWWVFVISMGVLLGNVLSYATYEAYTYWQLKQFMVSFDAMQEKQRQRTNAQILINKERSVQIRKESARQQSISSQLQETCAFWQQQTRSENTEQNRNYRDVACARVRGLFR